MTWLKARPRSMAVRESRPPGQRRTAWRAVVQLRCKPLCTWRWRSPWRSCRPRPPPRTQLRHRPLRHCAVPVPVRVPVRLHSIRNQSRRRPQRRSRRRSRRRSCRRSLRGSPEEEQVSPKASAASGPAAPAPAAAAVQRARMAESAGPRGSSFAQRLGGVAAARHSPASLAAAARGTAADRSHELGRPRICQGTGAGARLLEERRSCRTRKATAGAARPRGCSVALPSAALAAAADPVPWVPQTAGALLPCSEPPDQKRTPKVEVHAPLRRRLCDC